MRGDTLLEKAEGNFRFAVKNYLTLSGDELELNIIGYLLQQATELTIKHILEINGVRYEKTHQIEDLLDSCDDKNIPIQYTEEFYNFAPAITKWESKTRYIKSYVVAKKQIEKGMTLISEFLLANGASEENLNPPSKADQTEDRRTETE